MRATHTASTPAPLASLLVGEACSDRTGVATAQKLGEGVGEGVMLRRRDGTGKIVRGARRKEQTRQRPEYHTRAVDHKPGSDLAPSLPVFDRASDSTTSFIWGRV